MPSDTPRSQRNHHEISADSPANTPPTLHKTQGSRTHVVGAGAGARLHKRVPSYGKGLQKLTKAHPEGNAHSKAQRRSASAATSPETESMKRISSEQKLSRNGSTTSLKKNSSHVSLKRNRSHVEVRRPKSAGQLKRSASEKGINHNKGNNRTSVHFDLGDEEQEEGWTEASGSASPNLSRSGSIGGASSGRSSAKPPASAENSHPHSPVVSPSKSNAEAKGWGSNHQSDRVAPDAHQITSRLLQRTPSHNAAPKMSSINATATPSKGSPESSEKTSSTFNGTPHTGEDSELVSRFMGSGSGTPASPFLSRGSNSPNKERVLDEARKVKSMANLTRQDSIVDDEDDERALAPRSRKSSTHAYNPPQQSRTQQKLWLQRASSNIEPQQMAPGAAINGLPLRVGAGASPLVGAGDDGRDPRIRLQLDRTGLEYLVVRRYQDPIGRSLKRLDSLPGADKHRRIPHQQNGNARKGAVVNGEGRYGLSQSLREGRVHRQRNSGVTVSPSGARSSYEPGGEGSVGSGTTEGDDGGASTILRTFWEKNMDLNASQE
jgi:hypothetical protein